MAALFWGDGLELEDFYRALFQNCAPEDRATLWAVPGKLSLHLPVGDPAKIAQRSIEASAEGHDVYIGVCPRVDGLNPGERGRSADVARVQALWAEVDCLHPTHAAKNLPADLDGAARLLSGLPDPSASVWSGGGAQFYWLLDAPLEPARGGELVKRLQAYVRANADRAGLHVDAVHDVGRVLRCPGTLNLKDRSDPRPVILLELDPDRRYSAVGGWIPGAVTPATTHAPRVDSLPAPSPPREGAGVAAPGIPGPTLEEVAAAIDTGLRRLRSDRTLPLARAILAGAAISAPGGRDQELTRAAGLLGALAPPGARPEDVAELLLPSLAAMAREADDPANPAPTMVQAVDKVRRSMADLERKREARAEDAAAMLRGLRAASRANRREVGDAKKDDDDPDREERDEPYTSAELRAFEAEHGAPIKWVVQHSGAYYVLVNGRYQTPIGKEDLAVSLARDLAPTPINLTTWDKGRSRPCTPAEILQDHSVAARQVIADLTAGQGHYEPSTQVFTEAAGRRRPIEPRHDARVDQWLRLLGGPRADKLLDWVATVTRLTHQSCALYLTKTSGSGKSMLAAGLSRIWSTGGPTEIGRILDDWNGDLVRCPLVVADEKLPAQWRGQRASTDLRQLIGSSHRTLTRKFLPNVDLVGALRLMLIANDQSMLAFDEELGGSDMAAIASRFLQIVTTPEAARYLASIGGRRGTDGWVDKDIIAAHALWLRANRKVEEGSRFLVEGDAEDMSRHLAMASKMANLICEWIVRFLVEPKPPAPGAVRVGGGVVLVSALAMSTNWRLLIESDPTPSMQKIGRALSNLSTGVAIIGGVRYREVPMTYVLEWARQNLVGDPEQIAARVAAPLSDPKAQAEVEAYLRGRDGAPQEKVT